MDAAARTPGAAVADTPGVPVAEPPAGPTRTDRAPTPGSRSGRGIPPALLVALVLSVVVGAGAGWMALSSTGTGTGGQDPGNVIDLGAAPSAHAHPGGLDLTGQPAPADPFTTFAGPAASLADHRGRPVVVNFWGSWCPPCIEEMPAFERVHQAYGDRVRFVGLAVSDTEDAARTQARRTGVTYQLGFDPDGALARAFGLINLPSTVLIAPDGTVVHTHPADALTDTELTDLVEQHLRPPPAPAAPPTG